MPLSLWRPFKSLTLHPPGSPLNEGNARAEFSGEQGRRHDRGSAGGHLYFKVISHQSSAFFTSFDCRSRSETCSGCIVSRATTRLFLT